MTLIQCCVWHRGNRCVVPCATLHIVSPMLVTLDYLVFVILFFEKVLVSAMIVCKMPPLMWIGDWPCHLSEAYSSACVAKRTLPLRRILGGNQMHSVQ